MGCAKMIFNKISTTAQLNKAFVHNYRLAPVSSADDSRRHLNYEIEHINDTQFIFKNGEFPTYDGATFESKLQEKINNSDYYGEDKKYKKPKSNAVKAIEIVFELTKEEAIEIDVSQWAKDSLEWARKEFNRNPEKYGDNIVSAVVHMDEGAPHLHVLLIPIDEKGALNAKSYTNGYGRCVGLQTSYAESVKQHGLHRGLKASQANHMNRRKFYEAINSAVDESDSIQYQKRKDETVEQYTKRMQKEIEKRNLMLIDKDLKNKQKISELKTTQRNTLIEVKKEMHGIERERDSYKKKIEKIEKKHGSIEECLKKAEVTINLQKAFDDFPDEELVKETKKHVNKLLKYETEKQKEFLLNQNDERK